MQPAPGPSLPAFPALLFLLLAPLLAGAPVSASAQEGPETGNEASGRPLEVEIQGLSGELLDNVRHFLSITALEGKKPEEARIRRAHRRARGEIEQALQPFGYYNPRIQAGLQATREGMMARYTVEPGPPTVIETLELTIRGAGKDHPELQRVLKESGLAQGERLKHAAYSRAKEELLQTAIEEGFQEAKYSESVIRVRPEANRAEVHLVLETGPAFYVERVSVEQDILAPGLVRRMVPASAGERLTSGRLLDIKFALSDTDYFQRVTLEVLRERKRPYPEAPDQPAVQVPVKVTTTPRAPRRYGAGVGYGTDTGPRLSANAHFRRINRAGHQIRTEFMISPVHQRLTGRYQIPIRNVRSDRLTFSGTAEREELGGGRSEKLTLGASQDVRWHGWQRSLYLKYALERDDFSGRERGTRFLTPGASLYRSYSDDPLHPRYGWSFFVDGHGAVEGVLADATFSQVRTRVHGILPLGPRVRLLLRGEAGSSFVDRVSALSASERFFAGGSRSIRGYGYQQLGPRNASGDVVGGQHLLTGSAEIDLRVYGNWGIAAFYDAGNASNDWPPEPVVGIGGGLRWFSPIGSIRLDYAVPQDDPSEEFRIHVSIGTDL